MSNSSMWFDGPVADAVSLVNSKNCVFVVYICDDSANSQKLGATLDTPTVVQAIAAEAVALKMHKDSDNAKLFQQLYPTPHVPILYFIRQGTIKDFGTQDITPEEIVAKIAKVSSEVASSPQQPSVSSPQQPPVSSPQQPSVFSPQQTPGTSPQQQAAPSSSSAPAHGLTDSAKKEKLRKQMEEARKKREEKEKKDAHDQETKRRQDGKMMQHTRDQIEDQRNKQHFAKIKKEKREDEEHRRKIKEQIARDRAEQMAARQAAKQRKSDSSSTSPRPSSSSGQHSASSISIRQLDGSTIRNKFQASDTLGAVKDWIDQNRTDGDQPYKLLAQFPTRQFSIGEEQRSLRDLDLCPSATIIMKGIKNVSNAYGAGDGYGMMDYVYSAGGMLYSAASTVGSTMSGVVYSLFPSEQTVSSGTSPAMPASSSSSSSYDGQRLGGEHRTASNVNTLRTSEFDNDDDDRRTYNGNSLNQE